jgi:hypothetical protein
MDIRWFERLCGQKSRAKHEEEPAEKARELFHFTVTR